MPGWAFSELDKWKVPWVWHFWCEDLLVETQATDCSFLYFHRELMGALLSEARPSATLPRHSAQTSASSHCRT